MPSFTVQGEAVTWQKLSAIQAACSIELTFDRCLAMVKAAEAQVCLSPMLASMLRLLHDTLPVVDCSGYCKCKAGCLTQSLLHCLRCLSISQLLFSSLLHKTVTCTAGARR